MINETMAHDERAVYRAVTDAASNFPLGDGTVDDTDPFPETGSIPLARTMTGAIDTDGREVRGDGTLFISEGLKIGDYLYDDNGAVRQIASIEAEDQMTLRQGFPTDLTNEDVLYCERQRFKMIVVQNIGTANAIFQEAPIAPGERIVTGGAPVGYDASESDAVLAFTVHE